jgi:4-amino-4-deoxy-L-arabinose transferase-like glycosyltransferase
MLAAAAPWFIAVTIATEGRFLADCDRRRHAEQGGQRRREPLGPARLLPGDLRITAFPAAFLVLMALPGAWRDRIQPSTRFLLAWAVPVWLMFEAVTTKLPHYALPAYPALMLLAAHWALDPLRKAPPRWLSWLALFGLAATAVGLAAAAVALPVLADNRVSPVALLALPAAGLLAWVVVRAVRDGQPARAGLLAVVLAIPLQAVILEGVLPRLTAPWLSPRIEALVRAADPAITDERFGIAGYHEPSLMFALGAEIRLLGNGAEAARFLAEAPGRLAAVSNREERRFREEAAAIGLTPRDHGMVEGSTTHAAAAWRSWSTEQVDELGSSGTRAACRLPGRPSARMRAAHKPTAWPC